MCIWEQQKRLETAPTPSGEFVRQEGQDTWKCFIDFGDTPIHVSAGDVNGHPNPELLKMLSFISANWHSLENAARETVPELSEKHLFGFIKDSNCIGSFSLGFLYDEEDPEGELIYVDFKNDQVTGWSTAD